MQFLILERAAHSEPHDPREAWVLVKAWVNLSGELRLQLPRRETGKLAHDPPLLTQDARSPQRPSASLPSHRCDLPPRGASSGWIYYRSARQSFGCQERRGRGGRVNMQVRVCERDYRGTDSMKSLCFPPYFFGGGGPAEIQSHRERMCCICHVHVDKTRQESNVMFRADTHHPQLCSKLRTRARAHPSGAWSHILLFCLASPPAKTRKVDGEDGGGEKEKTSCFFLALLSGDVNKSP